MLDNIPPMLEMCMKATALTNAFVSCAVALAVASLGISTPAFAGSIPCGALCSVTVSIGGETPVDVPLDVDEHGAVDVPAAQGEIIDPEHGHGADLRVGQGSDHP